MPGSGGQVRRRGMSRSVPRLQVVLRLSPVKLPSFWWAGEGPLVLLAVSEQTVLPLAKTDMASHHMTKAEEIM